MKIPVSKISPNPQQPRRHFDQDYINGLAKSIRKEGLKTPVTVEDNGDGTYTLVDGECRLRAHKVARLQEIDAIVRPPTNHQGKQRLIDAMVANVARENMNVVDEAQGYRAMRQMDMSIRDISVTVGQKETRIRSLLFITDLEDEIQELIAQDKLPHQVDAVNALLSIPHSKTRVQLAKKLADRQATVKIVVKTCERYLEIKKQVRKARMKQPALEVAGMTEKPAEWDALYQVGKVPKWQKYTEAVMATCDNCNLRPMASEATCRDCPVVDLCRRLMELTK